MWADILFNKYCSSHVIFCCFNTKRFSFQISLVTIFSFNNQHSELESLQIIGHFALPTLHNHCFLSQVENLVLSKLRKFESPDSLTS